MILFAGRASLGGGGGGDGDGDGDARACAKDVAGDRCGDAAREEPVGERELARDAHPWLAAAFARGDGVPAAALRGEVPARGLRLPK